MVYYARCAGDGSLLHRRLAPVTTQKGVSTVAKCEMCGKSPQFGHNISHSNVRTKRQWRPNVQKATVVIDGVPKKMNICAKCLKTLNKA